MHFFSTLATHSWSFNWDLSLSVNASPSKPPYETCHPDPFLLPVCSLENVHVVNLLTHWGLYPGPCYFSSSSCLHFYSHSSRIQWSGTVLTLLETFSTSLAYHAPLYLTEKQIQAFFALAFMCLLHRSWILIANIVCLFTGFTLISWQQI